MSDEFDIPVDAGTEENAVAPVEETGPADAAVVPSPVSSPAASPVMDAQPDSSQQEEPVTEATTVDKNAEVATRLNLNANNDAGTSAAQQAWQENFGNTPAAEGAAPITAVAMAERQEAKDKKKEDALDAHEERQREFERSEARRKDWLERDHQMGDLTLSGADLEKLMNFIKNPAIQKKIESALKSKGVDAKAIQKGQSEMDEYIKLKEKEQERELTKEEKARLQQINKSPEFKVYAAEVSSNYQQSLKSNIEYNKQSAQVDALATLAKDGEKSVDKILADRLHEEGKTGSKENQTASNETRSAAYAHFLPSRDMGDDFKVATAPVIVQNNQLKKALEAGPSVAIVTAASAPDSAMM